MAEFCLDCWNEINECELSEHTCVLSKDFELCEGCGQMKHIVETPYRYGDYHPGIFLIIELFELIRDCILFLYRKLKGEK